MTTRLEDDRDLDLDREGGEGEGEGEHYYPPIVFGAVMFCWPLWAALAGATPFEMLYGIPIAFVVALWWDFSPLPNWGGQI